MFVYPLVPTIGFDQAEGKVRIHKLSIVEQILQTHNKFLNGVCFFQFDGNFHNDLWVLVGMLIKLGSGCLVAVED